MAFVQHQAPRLHPKRAKLLTSALRSFLEYARYRGEVKLDLAAAVPIVPNWSMSSIPRAIGVDAVRQLLASIDRSTAVGRRDYAILLLLARLGLRSGEVAILELDGIDWKAGQLSVRGKSGQRSELPLPVEVGKAIAAYLQYGRPQVAVGACFCAPELPSAAFMAPVVLDQLSGIAFSAPVLMPLLSEPISFGMDWPSSMLRQGASLGEIGELLGHHSPETTKIYTKVDLDALRTLAMPWPGGAR